MKHTILLVDDEENNFETACYITTPFLDSKKGLNGMPLKLSAFQALRNHYPELSQQDIAILFSAVKKFHDIRLTS